MTLRTRRIANRPTTRPSIPRSRGWVDCTVSFPRPADRHRPIRARHVPRRWAPVASPEDARTRSGVTPAGDRGVGVRALNVTGAPPPQVAGLLRPRCPLTRRRGGSATGFLSRCRRDIPSPQATGWFLDEARALFGYPVPASAARTTGRRTSMRRIARRANAIGLITPGTVTLIRCIVTYRRQSTPTCFIRARYIRRIVAPLRAGASSRRRGR
jgi:hypothetical protein